MRKRTAILHIGTAKTGTTTIQRMLLENRDRLLARGFCFPRSPGEKNHTRLAIAVAPAGRADKMARTTREAGDAAYVTGRFEADLAAEMADLPDSVHTCIFSNEHCYRKVDSVEAAARLKALLDPHFDRYRVVVYLRRQDEMAVSVYSTRLRSGAAHDAVLPEVAGNEGYLRRFDWHALVERWAAAFGPDAVAPRLFGRETFVGGDLLEDFFDVCGLSSDGLVRPEVTNSALAAPAQEFLRRLNHLMFGEDGADDDKAPQFVRHFVDAHFSGRGRRPARAEAEAFVAHFAESNESLRRGWFPDRAVLFGSDFSRYPDVADPLPTEAEVLDVALRLIAHQASAVPEQQAESAFDKAEKRIKAGRTEEARPLLLRTLTREPGHAGALKSLLKIARTPEDRDDAVERLRQALKKEPERADLRRLSEAAGVNASEPQGRAPRMQRRATSAEPSAATPPAVPVTSASREAAAVAASPRRAEGGPAARELRKAARREERRRTRTAALDASAVAARRGD
jgi:tetratricopeptide (TPR) repeat protein